MPTFKEIIFLKQHIRLLYFAQLCNYCVGCVLAISQKSNSIMPLLIEVYEVLLLLLYL